MKFRIGKLTCSQVVATVFILGWASCPTVFAVERGRQEGKKIAREVVPRMVGLVGEPQAGSLLDQLINMDVSTLRQSNTATASVRYVWERPEGTYYFGQMDVIDHSVSGNVMLIHPDGQIVQATVSRITVLDDNRIDFDVASLPTAHAPAVSAVGSVVGVESDPGTAIGTASANGSSSQLFNVNFNKAISPQVAAAGVMLPITVTAFSTLQQGQGGVACFLGCVGDLIVGAVTFIIGAIIGVTIAVALFVSVTCLAFGWFGCDSSFWWA